MRRKSVILSLGALLLVLGGVGAVMVLLARREPTFYRERAMAPGPLREKQNTAFVAEAAHLLTCINNVQPAWQATFTESQINSYFEEGFLRDGLARGLPDSISGLRVALGDGTIRVGFRYGTPPWSSVMSIDMQVWVVPQEINVIALEVRKVQLGSLPIFTQSMLQQISDVAKEQNLEVTWYRHNGNPVALLHFPSDRPRPAVQLQTLQVRDGAITLAGIALDKTPHLPVSPPVKVAMQGGI
jgi:hypothetical protein